MGFGRRPVGGFVQACVECKKPFVFKGKKILCSYKCKMARQARQKLMYNSTPKGRATLYRKAVMYNMRKKSAEQLVQERERCIYKLYAVDKVFEERKHELDKKDSA